MQAVVSIIVSIFMFVGLSLPAEAHTIFSDNVNGYPCGGDLPPCYVLQRESKGNPVAQNPYSSASGLWQMINSTANSAAHGIDRHDLVGRPAKTWTVDEQNNAARWLWDYGNGCSHWRAC